MADAVMILGDDVTWKPSIAFNVKCQENLKPVYVKTDLLIILVCS